jgi:hypothetical protein
LTAKQAAVRKVLRAITARAAANARREGDARVDGDVLTELYVRTAADVARSEEGDVRASAFLIGLGLGLDDSDVLRTNRLTAAFCKAVEPDDERKARLVVLGLPTVRGRRDLCQHFVVSAALTEFVGGALAVQAGLAKELLDMKGDSGFSFTDLCADVAGVEFANLAKKDPGVLDQWRRAFKVEEFVPAIDGLRDGMSEDQFKRVYGSVGDDRFIQGMADLRKRVRALRAYAPADR